MDHNDKILISLLNLRPSDVSSILSAKDDSGHLSIFLTLARKHLSCPFCASNFCLSKGFYSRNISIPHHAFENISVFLKVPRYQCPQGHSFSNSYTIAPANSKVSYDSIMTIMELLKDPKMTFSSVSTLTGLSQSTIVRIFDRHCHIPHLSFPEVICIDEVYTKVNAFDAKYSCIFYDFYNRTIIDVLPDRKKNYLHHYFQTIPKKELDQVRYICIDMYFPYKQIAQIYFKKAIICVDSFHVIKHLNDCLQKLRIRIMKSFNPDSIEYYLLKHFKCLLFDRTIDLDNKGKYNKKLKRLINYRQLLNLILAIDPQLNLAYHLKEKYTIFNATCSYNEAKNQFDSLVDEFILSNIPEYAPFIVSLSNWRNEIIHSFLVYKGKRINSSIAESLNATISSLLFNTKGIRNIERRRKRIMYSINKSGFLLK